MSTIYLLLAMSACFSSFLICFSKSDITASYTVITQVSKFDALYIYNFMLVHEVSPNF